MSERRFNEAEVAAIFRQATEAQQTPQRQLPSGEGLTLAELHSIGRDVGISADLIDHAALVISRGEAATSRSFLGLPVGVGLVVDLDRRLSDDEWERLVVDLRETFDARGAMRHEGSFRQWTNGNLQALLEPTPTGHRLRLRTVKGDARGMMIGGLAMFGFGGSLMLAALAQSGGPASGVLPAVGVLAAMGAGMFGSGALGLRGWARLRRQQMLDVAGRLASTGKKQAQLEPPVQD